MQVFMIGGKARNGKDTMAKYMKEYLESKGKKVCIMHLSSYLKNLIRNYFDVDFDDGDKPRRLLQELGTEVIRIKMGKEKYLTDRLIEDIEILENYYDTFIISDVRLPLEFDEIKKAYPNTIKIHIERNNFVSELDSEEKKHLTETALDSYSNYDYQIVNDTKEKLKEDSIKLVEEVISNA